MKTNITLFLLSILALAACTKVEQQPNLIVIYTDDQRTNTLSCYDEECPINTPSLDYLADNGVKFTNGFVTTPICGVSRACLISGRYMSTHDVKQFQKPLPEEVFSQSYPPLLKEAGYFLGIFGKYGFGVTKEQKQCFDEFDATPSQGPAFREYEGKKMHDAEWLTQMTKNFLEKAPSGRPFCLQLNYKEPHPTSVPAPEDEGKLANYTFERATTDTPEDFAKLPVLVQNGYGNRSYNTMFGTDEKRQSYLSHYYEKIMSVERSVSHIMEMLEQKGIADNTVVIFLSDHGTHHGEKQLGAKWTPYEQSLRIPFIVYDPRPEAEKGVVLDQMVLNIDVAPTLLDLAGISVPESMDGKSLKTLLYGTDETWRESFYFEHFISPVAPIYIPRNEGMRTKTTKYLRWIDMTPAVEEFYDLQKDPMETNNLIADPAYATQVAHLRQEFNTWRQEVPVSLVYNSCEKYSQSGVKEMDWDKFKAFRPKQYARIKAEVDRLGVTWEQALNDKDVRFEICKNAEYWY